VNGSVAVAKNTWKRPPTNGVEKRKEWVRSILDVKLPKETEKPKVLIMKEEAIKKEEGGEEKEKSNVKIEVDLEQVKISSEIKGKLTELEKAHAILDAVDVPAGALPFRLTWVANRWLDLAKANHHNSGCQCLQCMASRLVIRRDIELIF